MAIVLRDRNFHPATARRASAARRFLWSLVFACGAILALATAWRIATTSFFPAPRPGASASRAAPSDSLANRIEARQSAPRIIGTDPTPTGAIGRIEAAPEARPFREVERASAFVGFREVRPGAP